MILHNPHWFGSTRRSNKRWMRVVRAAVKAVIFIVEPCGNFVQEICYMSNQTSNQYYEETYVALFDTIFFFLSTYMLAEKP